MLKRLGRLMTGTLAFNWSLAQWRAALLCLPAVALPLAAGVAAGKPRAGMMMAAGAFSVGFGSFQELRGSRRLPMLIAAGAMCVSSWIGTLAGLVPAAAITLTGVWGAVYGAAWSASSGASWLALQCVIWLVISTAYPAHGLAALTRGSFVLAGGLLQMLVVWSVWRISGRIPPANPAGVPAPSPATARERAGKALHAATILSVAMALARTIPLSNSYWIPMTAAIVTRPAFKQTLERALARTLGTLAGAAVASLVAWLVHPSQPLLAGLVLLFGAAGYVLLFVNYAAFAATLTAYVVFLLTLAGAPERLIIKHRLLSTVVGAALAWLGHLAFARVDRAVTDWRAAPADPDGS